MYSMRKGARDMPIRDFTCAQCSCKLEDHYFTTDKDLKLPKCARCGGKAWKRMPPVVNVRFKGSGFYENDYKKKEIKQGG